MNYTLKELQERVNKLIEDQGEDAHCAAWIYTRDDSTYGECERYEDLIWVAKDHPELSERIFKTVGDNEYIYTVIQEAVDEATEEHWMAYQQELVEVE